MQIRTLGSFVAAVLLLQGCDLVQREVVDPPARAQDAADVFVDAWNSRDLDAMSTQLTNRKRWTAARLDSFFSRALGSAVTSTDVSLVGEVEQPSDEALIEDQGPQATATAPFEVTYDSDAATRPVTFEGEMELSYDRAIDRWSVAFDQDLLWPEHPGAVGFGTETKWPRRAAILDRHGKRLAAGADEERRYPFGAVGGTTVGHLEPSEEADRFQGGSGLEEALDERLAGTPTRRFVLLGAKAERCRRPRRSGPTRRGSEGEGSGCSSPVIETLGRVAGAPGRDIKTTLDVDVQRAAELAYGDTTGGSVVIQPHTGDLLAIVSSSPFGPQNYVGVDGIDPFNRALSGLYPPGSSLKVMTGAAALEEGVVTEATTLTGPAEYKGVRNFESGVYNSLDFATAVKFSVNTAFAQIAEDLGAKRLAASAELFGFNRAPRMPLGAATSSFPFPEDAYDLMWGSIGQAQVLATPLQMATVAATIANDGKRMEPRILLRDRPTGRRVVSKKVARTMTRLMEGVVQGGTGTGAAISGAQVAGKTGTAEVDVDGKRKNHAWFISFAPSTAPKVAVSVVSELGGIGGRVAAPLAGRILSAVLPLI